jgi:hypothetical protein
LNIVFSGLLAWVAQSILANWLAMQKHVAVPGAAPIPESPTEMAGTTPTLVPAPQPEIGGPAGPDPTRYGDWERKGRCIDF